MLDEFLWGRVSRISPEAPVPVVDITGESYYPGGAANVARNLREFTAGTSVMGRAGQDAWGERLMELLVSAGIDTSGIQLESRPPTIVKTRIIARHQQVVRVDRERKEALSPEQAERAAAYLDRAIAEVDGVVVADYGKGFLTQALADRICEQARAHGKVLTVDPHPHTSVAWHGATAIKPNRSEAFLAAGLPPSEPVSPVLEDRALLEVGEASQSVEGRKPPDHPRRTRDAADPRRRRRRIILRTGPRCLRRVRRGRYGDRRLHARSGLRRHRPRSCRTGQSRQRHRGRQIGHRHSQHRGNGRRNRAYDSEKTTFPGRNHQTRSGMSPGAKPMPMLASVTFRL